MEREAKAPRQSDGFLRRHGGPGGVFFAFHPTFTALAFHTRFKLLSHNFPSLLILRDLETDIMPQPTSTVKNLELDPIRKDIRMGVLCSRFFVLGCRRSQNHLACNPAQVFIVNSAPKRAFFNSSLLLMLHLKMFPTARLTPPCQARLVPFVSSSE